MSTYQDEAKQESRVRLEKFIRETVLTHKKPEEVTVLCFPGAEVRGQEAIEVKQVYDKLGIPRRNITGLEYDAEKAQRLKNAHLGISVQNTSDLEFARTTNKTFDIISLDYTGQQTRESISTLKNIAARGLLRTNGVLCTNYSTGREAQSMQLRYAWRKINNMHAKGEITVQQFQDALEPLANGELPAFLPLSDARDAITVDTFACMFSGKFALFTSDPNDTDPLPVSWVRLPDFKEAIEDILARTKSVEEGENWKLTRQIIRKAKILSEEEERAWDKGYENRPAHYGFELNKRLTMHIASQPNVLKLLGESVQAMGAQVSNAYSNTPLPKLVAMIKEMQKESGITNEDPMKVALQIKSSVRNKSGYNPLSVVKGKPEAFIGYIFHLAEVISTQDTGGVVPTRVERYSYVSNKRTPMFMDIASFAPPQQIYDAVAALGSYDRETGTFTFAEDIPEGIALLRALQVQGLKWREAVQPTLKVPPRVYLGSAAELTSRKEILTIDELIALRRDTPLSEIAEVYNLPKITVDKDTVLSLCDAGCTAAELNAFYNIPSAKTAAWKAHKNMGTYDEAKSA